MVGTRYLQGLKAALTGKPACTLVMVCNFEAERLWAEGYAGLPAPDFTASAQMILRMEELGSLLAGPDDVLVLKHPLDPGYVAYLEDLGLSLPAVLVPENTAPGRPTAQDVLDSPAALRRLAALAAEETYLVPMGTSVWEQRLAETCGIPLAVPDAETFQRVNSKIYGRRLAARAGLLCVPGACCETVEDFVAALGAYRRRLGNGGFRVVVKDAYGVSGKGLVVLDDVSKADRLTRMVLRNAERRTDRRLHVVVEEWLAKRCDLNYQVTVSRDGQVTLDFVKQALTDRGVHMGHLMPPELDPAACRGIEEAAQAVGRCLYADGYHGVAGIDGIVDMHGCLYPVLEINARLNMSTYQGGLTEQIQAPAQVALARHYSLRLNEPCGFADLRRSLWPALDLREDERFIVTCFGTVNANADRPAPYDGRLYAMLVASDRQRLAAIDRSAADALRHLSAHQEDR